MEEETWKPIPGFPGYEASDQGRIKSLKGRTPRILKTPLNQGYPQVHLTKNGRGYCKRVHYFIMLTFAGPRPKGLVVCHNDGNPSNNKLSNLRYDTPQANVQDAVWHGSMAKHLTVKEVVEVRNLRARGYDYQVLAEKYNTPLPIICQICTGRTRSKLPGRIFEPYEFGRQRAKQIKEAYATGHYTMTQLAKEYGLSLSAISLIVNNKRSVSIP